MICKIHIHSNYVYLGYNKFSLFFFKKKKKKNRAPEINPSDITGSLYFRSKLFTTGKIIYYLLRYHCTLDKINDLFEDC